MRLTVLSTGSSGNGYLLETDNEVLILECGVSLKETKKALNFDLSKIVGCFISHSHGDHAMYRKEYENVGLEMFTPYDRENVRENKQLGGYFVQAFSVPHGDCRCYGLLIKHKNGESALFITDFLYTQYSFKACKINNFIVECNYQHKYVDRELANFAHKIGDHCSFDTCKKFLEVNNTDATKNVLLVHYGFETCDIKECVDEVQKTLGNGVKVDYARKGEVYQL